MGKDIKVGIAGAVGRGQCFIGAFGANPHTTVTALCDTKADGLQEVAAAASIEQTYTDYQTMLDRAGLDVVVVGTPMHLHASQSIAALERNISVLCEVTAAVTVEECRRLVDAHKRSKATYMMAENWIYTRPNQLVGEVIKAGLLGDLYFGEGSYVHETRDLQVATPWRRRWHTGINGNTYITHPFGPLYQWFGEQRVVSVLCAGSGHHYSDASGQPFEQEDSSTTVCRLSGGGLVNLRLDLVSNRPPNIYLSVQGTKGCYESPQQFDGEHRIHLSDRHEHHGWRPLEELAEEFLPDRWRKVSAEAAASGHGGGDWLQVDDFVDALVEGREPPIGIHRALDMTLPGLASQISIARGSVWVDVPDSRDW